MKRLILSFLVLIFVLGFSSYAYSGGFQGYVYYLEEEEYCPSGWQLYISYHLGQGGGWGTQHLQDDNYYYRITPSQAGYYTVIARHYDPESENWVSEGSFYDYYDGTNWTYHNITVQAFGPPEP